MLDASQVIRASMGFPFPMSFFRSAAGRPKPQAPTSGPFEVVTSGATLPFLLWQMVRMAAIVLTCWLWLLMIFFWNQLENVDLFFQLFGGFSFALDGCCMAHLCFAPGLYHLHYRLQEVPSTADKAVCVIQRQLHGNPKLLIQWHSKCLSVEEIFSNCSENVWKEIRNSCHAKVEDMTL